MRISKTKWYLPAVAGLLGAVMFVAEWIGGDTAGAFWAFGVMLVFAVLVLLGGRSETVRGLRGDGRDERFRQIDVEATAIAGTAIIVATILGFVVEVARAHDGTPYTWLGAVAGVTYLAAVVVLRARR
jgi:presenilin-like A22 family membrane protease